MDTKPEVNFRKALFSRGFRYRLNVSSLPGKPDIVLPKWKAVVFVHGCFWHRHPNCRRASIPQTRTEFWQAKFRRNVANDKRNCERLLDLGWRVGIVWECALKARLTECADTAAEWLVSSSNQFEYG